MYHPPPISGYLRWMFAFEGWEKNLGYEDFRVLKKSH